MSDQAIKGVGQYYIDHGLPSAHFGGRGGPMYLRKPGVDAPEILYIAYKYYNAILFNNTKSDISIRLHENYWFSKDRDSTWFKNMLFECIIYYKFNGGDEKDFHDLVYHMVYVTDGGSGIPSPPEEVEQWRQQLGVQAGIDPRGGTAGQPIRRNEAMADDNEGRRQALLKSAATRAELMAAIPKLAAEMASVQGDLHELRMEAREARAERELNGMIDERALSLLRRIGDFSALAADQREREMLTHERELLDVGTIVAQSIDEGFGQVGNEAVKLLPRAMGTQSVSNPFNFDVFAARAPALQPPPSQRAITGSAASPTALARSSSVVAIPSAMRRSR